MALFKFTKSIINDEYIEVYNNGDMIRDFTYIDDIVHSIYKLLKKPSLENINFDRNNPDPSESWAPYSIFNIGNSDPKPLMEYIDCLEKSLGKRYPPSFSPPIRTNSKFVSWGEIRDDIFSIFSCDKFLAIDQCQLKRNCLKNDWIFFNIH